MPQDAIALLEADHQRVELLFRDYQKAGSDRSHRMDLAQIICMELTVHTVLEEELFYPAFRKASGASQLVQEAQRDHQHAKELIGRIGSASDPDPLVQELQRAIEEHVEEERREIFPKARQSGMDLAALGRQLEQRRSEIVTAVHEA